MDKQKQRPRSTDFLNRLLSWLHVTACCHPIPPVASRHLHSRTAMCQQLCSPPPRSHRRVTPSARAAGPRCQETSGPAPVRAKSAMAAQRSADPPTTNAEPQLQCVPGATGTKVDRFRHARDPGSSSHARCRLHRLIPSLLPVPPAGARLYQSALHRMTSISSANMSRTLLQTLLTLSNVPRRTSDRQAQNMIGSTRPHGLHWAPGAKTRPTSSALAMLVATVVVSVASNGAAGLDTSTPASAIAVLLKLPPQHPSRSHV